MWKRRVALIVAGLTFAALLAEVALRIAGVEHPVFSRPDDVRGWSLRPGAVGRTTREGGASVRINSGGLRDRERPTRKPEGVVRVAFLGDSFAEALEVPAEEAFWSVAERNLRRLEPLPGRGFEVLNFGVRGYGTTQELLTLRCCVGEYEPDVVLVAFFSGNDISDNSRQLDRMSTSYARPYYVDRNGAWEIDSSFRGSWRFRGAKLVAPLVAHSRVLQLVVRAHHGLLFRRGAPPEAAAGDPATLRRIAGDAEVYGDPPSEVWRDAWRVTEALLTQIAHETHEMGALFGVVILTNPIQVHPDRALRDAFFDAAGATGPFRPEDRLRELGERAGFPVLALAPELVGEVDARGLYLHGFENTTPGVGHWNSLGHRLAGERIARWIAGWPSTSFDQ